MADIAIDRLIRAVKYDPLTGLFTRKISARARQAGDAIGAHNQQGYIRRYIDGEYVQGHRAAWALYYGAFPDGLIDHINRVKDDNRIANLRIATASQNVANRVTPKNNASGRKGVTLHAKAGKWQSQIMIDGKFIYLGLYSSVEAAADAYAAKFKQCFGEFATLEEI